MAAVLAKKAAEPLLAALVLQAEPLRKSLMEKANQQEEDKWVSDSSKMPPSVDLLVECLIEEVEASPETLAAALQIAVLFARACSFRKDWVALARGPYGAELLHQAWTVYAPMDWPESAWVSSTFVRLSGWRKSISYWEGDDGRQELLRMLRSPDVEARVVGLFTCAGIVWPGWVDDISSLPRLSQVDAILSEVEAQFQNDDIAVWNAAVWAWIGLRVRHRDEVASGEMLEKLLRRWLETKSGPARGMLDVALATQIGLPRNHWKPKLTEDQRAQIREGFGTRSDAPGNMRRYASIMVSFHAGDVVSDDMLAEQLARGMQHHMRFLDHRGWERMRLQLPGRKAAKGPRVRRRQGEESS